MSRAAGSILGNNKWLLTRAGSSAGPAGLSSDGDIRDAGVTLRPLRRRHACVRSVPFRACPHLRPGWRSVWMIMDGEARAAGGL